MYAKRERYNAWGRKRGRGKTGKEKTEKRDEERQCIVPQFVDHDGVCIAGAFSDELPSAAFPRQNEIRTCELSSWPRRRRMPGYCSRWSFRASLFSSDHSAATASRGIDRLLHHLLHRRRRRRRRRRFTSTSGAALVSPDRFAFLLLRPFPRCDYRGERFIAAVVYRIAA